MCTPGGDPVCLSLVLGFTCSAGRLRNHKVGIGLSNWILLCLANTNLLRELTLYKTLQVPLLCDVQVFGVQREAARVSSAGGTPVSLR